MKLLRKSCFNNKVVIINGFPGCGKTLLSRIVGQFERVEIFQYSEEIERMCELHHLDLIDADSSSEICKIIADRQIYNSFLGRNINFRRTDLSSVFKNNPCKYLNRVLFPKDENEVEEWIAREAPILPLTTHMLLPSYNLLESAFQERLVFVEVVRHPLYMIIQQSLNFETSDSPRRGHLSYTEGSRDYPFFVRGLEREFDASNDYEKTILALSSYFSFLKDFCASSARGMIIPFEAFVKQPYPYLDELCIELDVKIGRHVKRELKAQKVPRALVADGPSWRVYEKCGWVPPKSNDEISELEIRRRAIRGKISKRYMDQLEEMGDWYVSTFLNGELS